MNKKKWGKKKIIKKQHPLPSPLLIFRVAHLEILPCLCSVTNPRAQVEENPLFFGISEAHSWCLTAKLMLIIKMEWGGLPGLNLSWRCGLLLEWLGNQKYLYDGLGKALRLFPHTPKVGWDCECCWEFLGCDGCEWKGFEFIPKDEIFSCDSRGFSEILVGPSQLSKFSDFFVVPPSEIFLSSLGTKPGAAGQQTDEGKHLKMMKSSKKCEFSPKTPPEFPEFIVRKVTAPSIIQTSSSALLAHFGLIKFKLMIFGEDRGVEQ